MLTVQITVQMLTVQITVQLISVQIVTVQVRRKCRNLRLQSETIEKMKRDLWFAIYYFLATVAAGFAPSVDQFE